MICVDCENGLTYWTEGLYLGAKEFLSEAMSFFFSKAIASLLVLTGMSGLWGQVILQRKEERSYLERSG